MKILLTADPEIPVPPQDYGGIERIVAMLIDQYVQKGHEVTLCANADSVVPCELVEWKGRSSQGKLDVVKNTVQLTSLVARKKFDIIHSFSRLAYMSAILPASMPKLMSYQREPTISQVKKATAMAKRGSLVFTGCSDYISDQIKEAARAITIYNCAPVSKYSATDKVSTDAPLVFLGRIEPIKGTDIAVEVALKTGKKLIIAGNVPEAYTAYFEEKIKPYLSEQVQYIGPVNDDQKNTLLGNALALLMPITWNEPFGIVMAEAMACGTPVLGFKRGSVPEIVTDGMNGYVSSTPAEMIAQVSKCSVLDRRLIRALAEQKFSDAVISDQYLSLYKEMIHLHKPER